MQGSEGEQADGNDSFNAQGNGNGPGWLKGVLECFMCCFNGLNNTTVLNTEDNIQLITNEEQVSLEENNIPRRGSAENPHENGYNLNEMFFKPTIEEELDLARKN